MPTKGDGLSLRHGKTVFCSLAPIARHRLFLPGVNFTPVSKSGATPLYYAALYGFQDLVEHLTVNDPNQVNATGSHYVIPLVAVLAAGHFQTAKFLIDNGAHPNVRGIHNMTPLLSAAYNGDLEMVKVLLKYKADINATFGNDWSH